MKVLIYDTHSYDREFLEAANRGRHELVFTSAQLDLQTAALANGFRAICTFVNDRATEAVIQRLAKGGTQLITQRSTGYNNIDVVAAEKHGITVMRVGSYSPYAVAEFAVGLLLALNRRIHRAYNRTREFNFRLAGLLGHDIHGSTVGVIGTGKIGAVFAKIMSGFGCSLVGYDVAPNPACLSLGMRYEALDVVLRTSDIVSLHVPLLPETYHLINRETLALMKPNAYLINTSRGGLIDTDALIDALRAGRIAGVGLDVYEEEEGVFFHDLSDQGINDDTLARLMTFPNVLVTGHQAFFTREAITTIAQTTIQNISDFEEGRINENVLRASK
ncbi:MAG: 2-hydroxyacid dehydrogenase [Kiritimatiellae bacterium]|nr:2-hydroxyacid dehydrogenase [Kiritimatiellia bacterium]MDW8459265.1 2-hydroxyacid dehydrogenase [Verrucomicrobiota bacterium]